MDITELQALQAPVADENALICNSFASYKC